MPAENPTNVRTFELAITGMTCSACAARIEKTLNRLPGVHANVNFATEKAHAAVADDVGIDVLLETVRKAGFEAREFNAVNNEALAVERCGGRVVILPMEQGRSTTGTGTLAIAS